MTYKLIIADDEVTIRNGLARIIPGLGLPVDVAGVAADGQETLRLVERIKPELMLLDINMPYINGLDLLEQVMTQVPESKAIIISGYDQFEYARRALQLCAVDYLLKPVNKTVLANSLSSAIKGLDQRKLELDRMNESGACARTQNDEDVLDRALKHIHNRFADPGLSLSALAASMHVSNTYLSKGIKQRTGEAFSNYITRLRMEQAMLLLNSSKTMTIFDIAERVGYASQHYFCRIFKEYTGKTPTEFRRSEQ